MARMRETLHITNGDAALYLLKKAGILGTHVAWRDSLYDGPVPGGLSLEETSTLRANYLAQRGYGNAIRLIHDFQRRDALVARAGGFEEVVLWFEHDLYDQLQMLQTLTSLETFESARVSLVQTDTYLSNMTVDDIVPLFRKRRTATAAVFKSARRSWERFTSTSPAGLYAAATENAIGLPFVPAALQRLCEEYPWTRDGLSRSQRQALYAVAQGPAPFEELFSRADRREEASFLGGHAFSRILDDFCTLDGALIEEEQGSFVPTALGRRVIAGDADWLDEHFIDRWIGGVHLVAEQLTRWDEDAGRFV